MDINNERKVIIIGAPHSCSYMLSKGCKAERSKWSNLDDIPSKDWKSNYSKFKSIMVLRNPVDRFRVAVENYSKENGKTLKQATNYLVDLLRIGKEKDMPDYLIPQCRLVGERVPSEFVMTTRLHAYCNRTQIAHLPPADRSGYSVVLGEKQKEVVKMFYQVDYDFVAGIDPKNIS